MNESVDKSINLSGGNISNSVVSTGYAKDIVINVKSIGSADARDAAKRQLEQDLQQVQTLLKQLQANNPHAGLTEAQTFLSVGLPKTTKERLLAALVSGGKAAIAEFLDNAYVNVVVAVIDGWRS